MSGGPVEVLAIRHLYELPLSSTVKKKGESIPVGYFGRI